MSESENPNAENPNAPSDADAGPDTSAAASSPAEVSPRDRFEQEVAARRESLDDHESEKTLWSGGYSPKAMFGWWIVAAAITIALLVAAFFVTQLTLTIALGIIMVLWLLLVANYLRMRMGFHYELTSQRFIHKTGIITRHSDRIEVIDIDDVSYQQGPIQRLFGVGGIVITSSDRSHPELALQGIDKVSEVAGLIDDVRRGERRRRSLRIDSI